MQMDYTGLGVHAEEQPYAESGTDVASETNGVDFISYRTRACDGLLAYKSWLRSVMMTMQTEPEIKRRFKPPDSSHHKSVHVQTSLTDYVTCEFRLASDLPHPAYSDSRVT